MTAAIDAAYAACEQTARAHYENFPVASVLLPAAMRRHVAAVYAFARAADDFADEGERSDEQRICLLDSWQGRLRRAVNNDLQPASVDGEPDNAPVIFQALAHTIRECSLPPQLLEDLLSAFKQDVTVHRYPNWETLFDYARRSANPVGRLVLRIAGYRTGSLDAWSDSICTGLQFTNFWQDFGQDFARGRVYLPQSELAQHGATVVKLSAGEESAATRRALRQALARTRQLFVEGRPLCDVVTGRLRYELRATWLGRMRILDCLERQLAAERFARPSLQLRDTPWFAWRLLTWVPQ